MHHKTECVAMLLAGGQGSRLYTLTNNVAKPAVSFGGKYKIIDFTLSNCINSHINTVGVLTQYQPLLLNEYIGNGQPWDMDRMYGGVHVLPPYQAKHSSDWYKGTANAIYQNLRFVDRYSPEYVLILSGDHIYSMNYDKLIEFHKKKDADMTIAVIDVPLDEASRFGILSTDSEGRIVKFEEKPKKPTSTKASMGIYLFSSDVLKKYLQEDAQNSHSSNDFGKDIIPKMLEDGAKMYAYSFSGYWKDVGTLESLWEANMDLLGDKPKFDIFYPKWKIHSRNFLHSPLYVGEQGSALNCLCGGGCVINGKATNSVLSEGAIIEEGATVIDSVIFDNVKIKSGARVEYSIIDENAIIEANAVVGASKEQNNTITVIGNGIIVGKNVNVVGKIVEEDLIK